jgi:hypothetical protein
MYQKPTQPALVGGVVDDAVKLYRASFRRCAPIGILYALVAAAQDLFAVAFAHQEGLPMTDVEALLEVYQQPPVLVMGLLQLVIMLALFGAVIVVQDAVVRGDAELGAVQAIGIGFARLGRLVLATVFYCVLVILALLLLFVPGVYLSNVLCLYPVLMYADDAGTQRSLEGSYRLTLGNWWHSATVLGAAVACVCLIAMLVDLAAGLPTLAGGSAAFGPTGMQLAGDVADAFLLPMLPAAMLALTNDLKLRQRRVSR